MPENIGVAPPDYTTQVGEVRAILGDTTYVEIPPTPPAVDPTGLGEYQYFGDSELDSFIQTGGSLEAALALAYNSMATAAAVSAKSVADFDLKISTEKRATELRLLAALWQGKADALRADIFEVFDTVVSGCGRCELAEWPTCGGCRGSQLF